jgi:hypothetical protein
MNNLITNTKSGTSAIRSSVDTVAEVPRLTTADRLENARTRVRFALCCADEGEATFVTLDAISRSLVAATSELERVAIDLDAILNRERMVR